MKMVRQSMIETLRSDYVRTARAMGLKWRDVLLRDGLRNAHAPRHHRDRHRVRLHARRQHHRRALFAWPGIGRYAYQAIQNNDLEALQGFVIMVGLLYVLLNVADRPVLRPDRSSDPARSEGQLMTLRHSTSPHNPEPPDASASADLSPRHLLAA